MDVRDEPHVQRAAEHLDALGFHLPSPPADLAGRAVERYFMGKSVVWEDLAGGAPTDDEVIAGFSELNSEAVVALLFRLSWLLEDARALPISPQVQVPLADWLFPGSLAASARRRLTHPDERRRRAAVVHHEQLLAATAVALAHGRRGSPTAKEPDEELRHRVGAILLKVSSRLYVAAEGESENDIMLGATVRQSYLVANESPALAAARSYELLVERAEQAHSAGRLRYDLRGDFVAHYGIEPEVFTGLGILHAAQWMHLVRLSQTPAGIWDAGQHLVDQLRQYGLDGLLHNNLVADRAWFEEHLQPHSVRVFDVTPLYRCPVLRRGDGGLVPLNWRLLLDRVFAGLFWAMHSAHREQGGAKQLQDWMGQLGAAVHQPYVDARMQAIYGRNGAAGRYINEQQVGPYRGADGQPVDGADGYVVENRRLVLFDVTASALPVKTMLSGDGALFRRDAERLLLGKKGKLTQLDRVTTDLIAARLRLPGVLLSEIQQIIPLVITAAPFPMFPTVWSEVRGMWTAAGLFCGDERIVSPQLIDFEELEWLQERLTDGSLMLADVLVQREASYRGGSLKNFLARNAVQLSKSQMMNDAFNRYRMRVTDAMRRMGIPETA